MAIKDIQVINFPTQFKDARGDYNEIYNTKMLDFDVKQVSVVRNNKNVLRGMHGDWGTSKLVSVLDGEVIQVAIDCRAHSPSFGEVFSINMSAHDKIGVYIPAGVANGFRVISDKSLYMYLQNTLYGDFSQFTITPTLNALREVFGDIENCIMSERDMDTSKTLEKLNDT